MGRSKTKKSFDEWADEASDAQAEETALQRQLSRKTQIITGLRSHQKFLEKELEAAEGRIEFCDSVKDFKPGKIKARLKSKSKREATAILCLSDLHVGEVVDPECVNGKNKYTPEIARQSIRNYFRRALDRLIIEQNGAVIDDVILWLGGDLMTGYIHEELMEGNAISPTEEILLVLECVTEGIDYLMNSGLFKRLTIVCNYGNHGRTSHKKKIATGAKNSFEWLAYNMLAMKYASVKNITWRIANGIHEYVEVYDTMIRFHHGDAVLYYGGVGGLAIPMRKASDAWNNFQHADITIVGHYHQFNDFGYAIVNGSTKGYDPFALSIKARFEEPSQAFVLIDKIYGKVISTPIYVR